MNTETIKAISSVDSFHKNCLLLFEDITSTIKEKTLTNNVSNIVAPEGGYWVWDTNQSEHQRQYVFLHDNEIRFVSMYVKIKEEKLQNNSTGFKQLCHNDLDVDPIYPLIIVMGVFKPRDRNRFLEQLNVRRNWLDNTILLRIPEDIQKKINQPQPYNFEELLEIETSDDVDSWYCERSIFRIKKLSDIKDSNDIETLVDELLQINV